MFIVELNIYGEKKELAWKKADQTQSINANKSTTKKKANLDETYKKKQTNATNTYNII